MLAQPHGRWWSVTSGEHSTQRLLRPLLLLLLPLHHDRCSLELRAHCGGAVSQKKLISYHYISRFPTLRFPFFIDFILLSLLAGFSLPPPSSLLTCHISVTALTTAQLSNPLPSSVPSYPYRSKAASSTLALGPAHHKAKRRDKHESALGRPSGCPRSCVSLPPSPSPLPPPDCPRAHVHHRSRCACQHRSQDPSAMAPRLSLANPCAPVPSPPCTCTSLVLASLT